MSRLFITKREIDFISDITSEVIKDVIGQKIFYYPVSVVKTDIHDVYEEAVNKVFENPIEIDALVEYSPEDVKTNIFGHEEIYKLDVFLHHRDLLNKQINCKEGDFFSYGSVIFEVLSSTKIDNVYGQTEHYTGIKLSGKQARKGQFTAPIFGPTSEEYSDSNAVQDTFEQQRGYTLDSDGNPTGDIRANQQRAQSDDATSAVLEPPITGPAVIDDPNPADATTDSAFYGDGDND